MTGVAIFFMVLSMILVWGGCAASVLFLRARPERTQYPAGGVDDERESAPIVEHDT